jgi:transposase
VRKQLRRSQVIAFFTALPPCLIGMVACATAHYWARELRKLGHEVRAGEGSKTYVKRNKNDAADAVRADQVGRAAGSVDAAPHARRADTPAHPDHQRVAGASSRARHQGDAGVNELQAIVADDRDEPAKPGRKRDSTNFTKRAHGPVAG